MVANFVSADYGWLTSTDNSSLTQILFKAGKQHEGYLTNSDILAHASGAIDILDKDYVNKDHVLIMSP
jgi:5,10-methylene-tetrahydrofolate dehydrogenase/methenyl tetrahydrofolate cyclohydrolase